MNIFVIKISNSNLLTLTKNHISKQELACCYKSESITFNSEYR